MPASVSRFLRTALACSALVVAGLAHAAAPAKTTAEPIAFAKGADTATVKGRFKGPKRFERDYAVPMTAGGTLEVSLQDKPGKTYASIYRPGEPQKEGEGRKRWTIKPTVDGTYVVHVFLTRSAVDKGESSTYELTVARK